MPAPADTEALLKDAFSYIDGAGVRGATAEVRLFLASNQELTMKAGGPGIHSEPASPPFQTYEVLVDHDPPRFWTRYADGIGCMFTQVPKLLICHHVIRAGGVNDYSCRLSYRSRTGLLACVMSIPEEAHDRVVAMMMGMPNAHFISSTWSPQP